MSDRTQVTSLGVTAEVWSSSLAERAKRRGTALDRLRGLGAAPSDEDGLALKALVVVSDTYGIPYHYGAKMPPDGQLLTGVDCSLFIQWALGRLVALRWLPPLRVAVPRVSSQQEAAPTSPCLPTR